MKVSDVTIGAEIEGYGIVVKIENAHNNYVRLYFKDGSTLTIPGHRYVEVVSRPAVNMDDDSNDDQYYMYGIYHD